MDRDEEVQYLHNRGMLDRRVVEYDEFWRQPDTRNRSKYDRQMDSADQQMLEKRARRRYGTDSESLFDNPEDLD